MAEVRLLTRGDGVVDAVDQGAQLAARLESPPLPLQALLDVVPGPAENSRFRDPPSCFFPARF
jgi:hypothetical protein